MALVSFLNCVWCELSLSISGSEQVCPAGKVGDQVKSLHILQLQLITPTQVCRQCFWGKEDNLILIPLILHASHFYIFSNFPFVGKTLLYFWEFVQFCLQSFYILYLTIYINRYSTGLRKYFLWKIQTRIDKVWNWILGLKRHSVSELQMKWTTENYNLTKTTTTSKGLNECIFKADDNQSSVKRNNTTKVVWVNLWLEQSRDIKNFDSRIYPKLLSGLL